MGHALVIPNADFSDVAVTQVTLENKNYNFSQILQNFITVTGYTPNTVETTALEHLTTNLIKYNIWNKIDALYLLLGTTYATCRYNWKDPSIYIANAQDHGEDFNLTNEHEINDSSMSWYIIDFNDLDVNKFHSVCFSKFKRESIN